MKKYRNDNAAFSEVIDIFEPTDPVDADSVDNVPLKQLHDNDLVLRDSINNTYSFIDQVLAATFLNYQRMCKLTTFEYDEKNKAIIAPIVGCTYKDKTVTFTADTVSYDGNGTIELTIDADYPFGVDGYIFNDSNKLIISSAGDRFKNGTYFINSDEALYDGAKTLILPSGATGLSALMSTSDIGNIAALAAGIVEANATSPSDEDIDNLFINTSK